MPVLTSIKSPVNDNGLSLTLEEVASLLDEQSSSVTLATIADKIGSAYSKHQISDKDTRAAEQIFRLLLRETETHVRRSLAEHIKSSTIIPRDIVLTLAHDIAEVSLPVLQYSEVLADDDLLELIDTARDSARYLAIARRASISEQVSGSLLNKGGQDVAASLVENSGARISEEHLTQIIAAHAGNEALMQMMQGRPGLPVTIAEKLVHVVAKNLGDALKQKHRLPEKEFALEVDKTREDETLRLIRQSDALEDIDRLVGQLIAFNRLTPSLLLNALCQGDLRFFEIGLARLAGVPIANARTLINDRGELGFRALYNQSGLPEPLFRAIHLLVKASYTLAEQGQKSGMPGYTDKLAALLQQHSLPVENLSYIVALVRKSAR